MLLKIVRTPITNEVIQSLKIGDSISLTGYIYAGRDAALPRVVELIKNNELEHYGINLKGSVVFHTAVSPAGVGPTSSNKVEIESSIPMLSEAGVKLHLGKGKLSNVTINELKKNNSVFATIPPVTALLSSRIKSSKLVAFEEEGMEAFYQLEILEYPAVVTIAHGESIL